jgi:RNA polymerase sigma-70 factor (ECF subfamily)
MMAVAVMGSERVPVTTCAEELDLVARLRAGDEPAFETLVNRYGARLLAVARRFLRDEEEARDAVQDAFLSAFRSVRSFKAESRISTWLHRIVVNVALMRLRTRRRKPEESLEPLLPTFSEDGHHQWPVLPWRATVETELERKETAALVRAGIDRLPESYRTVLILRDFEELDTEETARLLGISLTAAKIRLHRARQALRAELAPHFEK